MTQRDMDGTGKKSDDAIVHAFRRIPKAAWAALACVSFLSLNYNSHMGFYFSFLAFVAVMACLVPVFGKDTKTRAGFGFTRTELFIALPVLAALTAANYHIIMAVAHAGGAAFTSLFELGARRFYVFTVFQTLNEEIIAGALPLFFLRRKFPSIHPLAISVLAALVFSAAHFFMYRYLFLEHSIVGCAALASLFAVGLVRNNLILGFGHILFSWALHLSWNAVFFGGKFTFTATGKELTQARLFNIVMGNGAFLAGISVLAAVSILFLYARNAAARRQGPCVNEA